MTEELSLQKQNKFFPLKINNVSEEMKPWIEEADKRIFCLGAGERVVPIACTIMSIGFGKILYAANELGANVEDCKPFILFAPDCTISFNKTRNERGFSYGALVKGEFSGMISTNNSMPNACGYTIGELIWDKTDVALVNHLKHKQKQIGKDYLQQLGKGNHFSAVYCVKDPITGEDTMKRYINVHSSGKLGTRFLYNLDWLNGHEGYHKVETPHGLVELLEGDARTVYLEKYHEGDKINAFYREEVLEEIIGEGRFKILEEITHQGLSENGDFHRLGVQVHDGEVPIAFNSEEGMIIVEIKQNLSDEFLRKWEQYDAVKALGYRNELKKVNFSPHGGGYEFRLPVKGFTLNLSKKGVKNVEIQFSKGEKMLDRVKANYFREVKGYMCFRRKLPLMREVFSADLIEHIYDLEPLMQIYPLVSIVGGTL